MTERTNMNTDKCTPPDDIELRVRPKPVRRINRKVLMGGTAMLSLVLFGAVLVALDPPDFRGGQQVQELYNTDRKPVAWPCRSAFDL
jgi:type IV secretion system protein TrbI